MEQKLKFKESIRNYYSQEFKQKIVEEYLRSGEAKAHIQKRHGIKGNSAIQRWLLHFEVVDPYPENTTFDTTNSVILSKDFSDNLEAKSIVDLQNELSNLKRKLEDEKIRSEAYLRMIEIAESDFKIPIRKKSNTK